MHDFEKWLKVLGLASGATRQAIAEAYRDLVKVWHPDRFGSDARLRQKAQEKLKELNEAFEHLQDYRPPERPAASARSSGGPDAPPGQSVPPSATSPPDLRQAASKNRITTALIGSAVLAGVGVWLLFLAGRGVGEPARATGAVESSTATGSARPSSRPQKPSDLVQSEPPDGGPSAKTGTLRIESQPTGAVVSFDGRSMGETPLLVTDITPGEHRIGLDLERRGYRPWASPVVVTSGHEEKLLAVLTPNAPVH